MKVVMSLFLICASFCLVLPFARASPTTTIYVVPSSIVDSSLAPESSFTVSVNVADAVDLYAWQVNMSWNTALLNATEIAFGDFLVGQPEGTAQFSNIDNAEGRLLVGEVIIGAYPGVDGDGWLCSITFLVEMIGETVLDIDSGFTYYVDSFLTVIGDDPGELAKESGYFNNFGATIPATIDIYPETLKLKTRGGSITAYIELPQAYSVNNVDILTVKINSQVPARLHPTRLGDYDEDGSPDLMVKFSRREVAALLVAGENTLTITGEVSGEMFEGFDTVTAI